MSKQRKRNQIKDQIQYNVVEVVKKTKGTTHNKSTPPKQKKADCMKFDNK